MIYCLKRKPDDLGEHCSVLGVTEAERSSSKIELVQEYKSTHLLHASAALLFLLSLSANHVINLQSAQETTTPSHHVEDRATMMEDFVKELVTAENDKYNAQQQQFGDALIAFHQAQSEKSKSIRESAAPRRERDLLQVFSEYKGRLKTARLELDTAKNSTTTYDSDDSDIVELKREIALCKRKRNEIFALLS